MDKDDVVATLNDLIETSRDGEEGFRTCADGVKSSQLKQMFQHIAKFAFYLAIEAPLYKATAPVKLPTKHCPSGCKPAS